MKNIGEKMRRLAQAVRAAANALRPRLRTFWDRFGYVTSMVALLALIGAAATIYRGRANQPSTPAPTVTPEPALASSLNLGAEAEEEEAQGVGSPARRRAEKKRSRRELTVHYSFTVSLSGFVPAGD